MRISDWSSDVCSSDLGRVARRRRKPGQPPGGHDACVGAGGAAGGAGDHGQPGAVERGGGVFFRPSDRKSVVKGKSVSVRVDLGGRRILKKKISNLHRTKSTRSLTQTVKSC